jgi:hypothetical protein
MKLVCVCVRVVWRCFRFYQVVGMWGQETIELNDQAKTQKACSIHQKTSQILLVVAFYVCMSNVRQFVDVSLNKSKNNLCIFRWKTWS